MTSKTKKHQLLPIENHCLKIIKTHNRPLSTKQIFTISIRWIFLRHFREKRTRISQLKKDLNMIFKNKFKKEELQEIITGLLFEIDEPVMRERFIKTIEGRYPVSKLTMDNLYLNKSETNKSSIQERILSYYKIAHPSYLKLLNTLNYMETINIVKKRYEDNRKARVYWMIN